LKRWLLAGLIVLVIIASLLVAVARLTSRTSTAQRGFDVIAQKVMMAPHLLRLPHSAYKYDLCVEAFAYAFAAPDDPHKTDYTFPDPFRKANDTIIPYLMNQNTTDHTVTFSVQVIIGTVAHYTLTIAHVTALDGIAVVLPDTHNHLQQANEPQFIVSMLAPGGSMAILDYTCPQQWTWNIAKASGT
jgi:hypothetical protein